MPTPGKPITQRLLDFLLTPSESLKKLTEGLFYPSALACGFIAIVMRFKSRQSTFATLSSVEFWLAIALLTFFSASFLHTAAAKKEKYYRVVFALDTIEAVITTFMLNYLGYLEIIKAPDEFPKVNLTAFYALLLAVLAIQTFWQFLVRQREKVIVPPGIVAFAIALFGIVVAVSGSGLPPHITHLIHLIFALALIATVVWYLMMYGPLALDKTAGDDEPKLPSTSSASLSSPSSPPNT